MSRLSRSPRRVLAATGALLLLLIGGAGQVRARAGEGDCLACHADGAHAVRHLEVLRSSVHRRLACTDCHQDREKCPLPAARKPVACGECHAPVEQQYAKSIHGVKRANGDRDVATCTSCHGAHDIRPSADRASQTNKFNLHRTCAACHQNTQLVKERLPGQEDTVGHFVDSIHGRALLVDGLAVAPTCNDCHGVHDIQPPGNPASRISKGNVPRTCGKCHVLVEDIYNQSIHGRLLAAGDPRGPVCITCHTSHQIDKPVDPAFRLQSDQSCGKCHMDRLQRYRETFHGKAIALGRQDVAACYDCHGHHDVQQRANPASHISDQHRLATCRKCHPQAPPNFANYLVHADHTNRADYPLLYYTFLGMTLLIIGTFAFFGVHSLFWLLRTALVYWRDARNFRAQKQLMRRDPEQYIRFRPVERFMHGLLILSFLLLVVTGMPLKFYDSAWARGLFAVMGGQAVASVLHRAGAMNMIFIKELHVSETLYSFFAGWERFRDPVTRRTSWRLVVRHIFGPDSPAPNWQDAKDFWAHVRWCFGRGEKPQFDRWTYWEKFDYLAVFWGVAIIGGSGLVMAFPRFFTTFLPGWIINVALIVHSDEALLAAGFIFTFHFFNVHFRPEKFPLDPAIFSGRINRAELLGERRRLWERWQAAGKLETHSARRDEWESWKWIALPAGFVAFTIGVVLAGLIFYAMLARLLRG